MRNLVLLLLIVNLWSTNNFAQGESLFDDSYLHEIHFTAVDTNLIDGQKIYQLVNMTFDGIQIDSIGFKDKGNISSGVPNKKLPLKIKTNKYISGHEYDGIKEFTLHNNYQDPSMMREKLSYDICRDLGLHALRTAFTKVYINNEYWGLYTIVEGKDEYYKLQFGDRDADAIESLDFGTMCYLSENPSDYDYDISGLPYYILENGHSESAFEKFAEMIDVANNTSIDEYMDIVPALINLDDFIRYQAANVYMMNFDSYIGFNGNQIYMHDSLTNQWQIIPWDFNASLNLWDNGNGTEYASEYPLFPNRITEGCIASKLNDIAYLKDQYLETMCRLSKELAEPEDMIERIDAYKSQIQQAVYDDWRKVYSNEEFDLTTEFGTFSIDGNSFEGLKTFFDQRAQKINQEVESENYLCTPSNSTSIEDGTSAILYYPNPVQNYLYSTQDALKTITIFDAQGRRLKQIQSPTFPIYLGDLGSGIYFLITGKNNREYHSKLIIQRD